MCPEVVVGQAEVMVAEETVVCRQRRGMCRGQYQVTGAVNESSLFLSVCTPEDEHKVFPFVVEGTDCSVGKFFPATALVGAGCMSAYCQGGIEHQYTLFRPTCQVAAGRYGLAQVSLYFLENVLQGGREGNPVVYREAQSVSLSRTVIGVLSDDDHFHPVKRTEVESIED